MPDIVGLFSILTDKLTHFTFDGNTANKIKTFSL